MAVRPLADLRPGMTVSAAVTGPDGRVLVPVGRQLDARLITVLRAWGIPEVDVGSQPSAPGSVDPALVRTAEQQARFDLGHADIGDPFARELLRLCALRRLRSLLAGGGRHA